MMCRDRPLDAARTAEMHALEAFTSFKRCQFGAPMNRHVLQRGNTLNQIARHALFEARAADEHMNVLRVRREKHDGLSRGVTAAHEQHRFFATKPRLDRRGPGIDAAGFEVREPFDIEAPVLRAARDHDGTGCYVPRVGKLQDERVPVAVQSLDFTWDTDMRAELLRLGERAARQRMSGDPRGKPQVIFDARTRTCLTAGRSAVESRYR